MIKKVSLVELGLFLYNPYKFAITTNNKYGELYKIPLAGKELIITSNSNLIHLIEKDNAIFFEPYEITKTLGNNSILLDYKNHKYLKNKFIYALSKLNLELINIEKFHVKNNEYLKYYKNNYDLKNIVNHLLLEIISNLFVFGKKLESNIDKIKIKINITKIIFNMFENLTWDVLFFPFLKFNLGFNKWAKYNKYRNEFNNIVKILINVKDSFPNALKELGLHGEEIIDNSLLFFFASFDNPSITILNTFIEYGDELDFLENIEFYIDKTLSKYPPIPFILKTITKPILFNKFYFPEGSSFGIDLINSNTNRFGFGNKKCPGKQFSLIIMKEILIYIKNNFKFDSKYLIIRKRQRFSYGSTIIPVKIK